MDKLPIVEALLSEEEDEYGSLVPLNRHGEKAAEIIEALVAALDDCTKTISYRASTGIACVDLAAIQRARDVLAKAKN